jgi:hypothetical protein
LFRAAVKAIAARDPDAPQPRRSRRSGETGKAFTMAARTVMHRAVRLPPQAYAAATAFLADTLDWLGLWQHDPAAAGELTDDPAAKSNHLSLGL